jgi:glycine cleavage system H protein
MGQEDLRFAETHEWVRIEGDIAIVGLSDYAQQELGDIVFVEAPLVGQKVTAKEALTSVESVKSVSEMCVPVDGEIVEVNVALDDNPGLINSDPYGEGWVVKIRMVDASQLDCLMTAADYDTHTKG